MYFLGVNGFIAKEKARAKKLKNKVKSKAPLKKLHSKMAKGASKMRKKIKSDFKKIGPTNVIRNTIGADKQARGISLLHNA